MSAPFEGFASKALIATASQSGVVALVSNPAVVAWLTPLAAAFAVLVYEAIGYVRAAIRLRRMAIELQVQEITSRTQQLDAQGQPVTAVRAKVPSVPPAVTGALMLVLTLNACATTGTGRAEFPPFLRDPLSTCLAGFVDVGIKGVGAAIGGQATARDIPLMLQGPIARCIAALLSAGAKQLTDATSASPSP